MSKVVIVPEEGLDTETKQILMQKFEAGHACRWCGGLHDRECPRVRKIIFHPNDDRAVREVEFWADQEWDKSCVIWPEDVV